jgi:2-dehydropantoate 2-reductase
MKILIYGAGVIGQVYGGRLAQAGHAVTLLARAPAARALAEEGVTLRGEGGTVRRVLPVVTRIPPDEAFDVIFVCVRQDQFAPVLPELAETARGLVVFLLNHFGGLTEIRDLLGPDRVLFGFPGLGGGRAADGAIEYIQIRQQHTTLERDDSVAGMLREAGFAVDVCADMDGWLKTHAVFVTAMGAAILAAQGDSAALAADPAAVRDLVAAVGEGFGALARQGVAVVPRPLRLIFTAVPRFAAVRYWRAQLRGPVGTLAIAPHISATRDSEFPVLVAGVRKLIAGYGPTPHLDRLLAGISGPAAGTGS